MRAVKTFSGDVVPSAAGCVCLCVLVAHTTVELQRCTWILVHSNGHPFAPAHHASTVLNDVGRCVLNRDDFDAIRRTRDTLRGWVHSSLRLEQMGCHDQVRIA